MKPQQKIVAVGALSGVATMIILVWLLSAWLIPAFGFSTSGFGLLAERIAFTLRMNVIAMSPLFVMIVTIGNSRFLSAAINPLDNAESETMKIDGRVTENSLQQFILFLVASLALATVLTAKQMAIIPAVAIVHVIARFGFWYGYRQHPLLRAPGMAGTSYLTLFIMVYVIYRIVS